MAVQEPKHQALIEKRARALMVMLLTRLDDLLIEEPKEDIGLDYVVRFRVPGKEGLREFGIQVKGVRAATTKDEAERVLRPGMEQMKQHGPFLRPACLVLFTMDDNGWYTWVAEPVEAEHGQATLRPREEPDCRPLDKRSLNEIVERVDIWHDALVQTLIVNGPGAKDRAPEWKKSEPVGQWPDITGLGALIAPTEEEARPVFA